MLTEADPARRQAARVAGERTHGVPPCHPDAEKNGVRPSRTDAPVRTLPLPMIGAGIN